MSIDVIRFSPGAILKPHLSPPSLNKSCINNDERPQLGHLGFAFPYAVGPGQGNLGGKIALFEGNSVCAVAFTFSVISESKGRSYIEIDELWSREIPPRKFTSTQLFPAVVGGKLEEV